MLPADEPSIVLSRIPPIPGPEGMLGVPVGEGNAMAGADDGVCPAALPAAAGVLIEDVGEPAANGEGSVRVLSGLNADAGPGSGRLGRWDAACGAGGDMPGGAGLAYRSSMWGRELLSIVRSPLLPARPGQIRSVHHPPVASAIAPRVALAPAAPKKRARV